MRSIESIRTERGLLVAGCLFVAVLSAGLLVRPAPTGTSQLTLPARSGEAEAAISAELPPTSLLDESLAGASSKEAVAGPTTTITGASAAAFPYTVHDVANTQQWLAATNSAQPGDVIRLVATINQPLSYRGSRFQPEKQTGTDGTADRPITITAAPGIWIDPGNQTNRVPALDIAHTSHIQVIGVRVRNSQFGIRVQHSVGSPESPILLSNNEVTDIGHAGIHVTGHLSTHEPSRYIRVIGNTVTKTGRAAPEFGEGIYLGYGSQEWVDNTSGVEILNNEISFTTAEGIDVKPGTRNVLVEGNMVHDLSPIRGGAISAHYVGGRINPAIGTNSNLVIRRNRIWNVNLDGTSGSNDWAIWVGHGGVTIENNVIWGLRNDPNRTRAVRIRGLLDFGPHPIRIIDNVFWTATGWVAEGSPSAASQVQASGNQGSAGASGVEISLSPHPVVPALGAGGTADSGVGPGSGFGFAPDVDLTWVHPE
ncbi:MAG: hypothetical protein GY773_01920 [Actinomycetia bacterium]|nr:hypothetical protein [Actinomycetes bacterium]